jgi:pimeloyl-ACP methyl ester carboxylesterase
MLDRRRVSPIRTVVHDEERILTLTTVNGLQIFHVLQGDGPPLAFVHGAWGNHHNWDAVTPRFAESFTVLTYDRRGHSQSERASGQGSIAEDGDDLANMLKTLHLAPAHIVGSSSGASIVLHAAITHPEVFRSLTVHEPPMVGLLAGDPAFASLGASLTEAIESVLRLLRTSNYEEGARLFAETIAMGPRGWERLPDGARRTWIENAPTFLDESNDPLIATIDLHALARLDMPMLLTHGDQSPAYFQAVVMKLAAALPAATVHCYEGAGHVPQLSHPDAYVQRVSAFLTGVR